MGGNGEPEANTATQQYPGKGNPIDKSRVGEKAGSFNHCGHSRKGRSRNHCRSLECFSHTKTEGQRSAQADLSKAIFQLFRFACSALS